MWANLVAGYTGVGPITLFDPTGIKTKIAAEVKGFDPEAVMGRKEARRSDRYTQFAVAAAQEAIRDASLDLSAEDPSRVGVLIGSGVGGIGTILQQQEVLRTKGARGVSPFLIPGMLINTAAGHIAIQLGLRGPNYAVASACATGTDAIGTAFEMIRRGDAEVMLAGGSEAPLVELAVAGFENMTALSARNAEPQRASRPFDAGRDGFVIAEGAAVLVLESLAHAQGRGARIYGELLGYANTEDAYHITAPHAEGIGAVEAMSRALHQAGLAPDAVDYVNAHGTSTPLNDSSETRALKRLMGPHAFRVPVSSTKSMTGHLLGAAGAVEAAICFLVLQKGIIPPTINYDEPDPDCDLDYVPNAARRANVSVAMSPSFGFGGHNSVLVMGSLDGYPGPRNGSGEG
jgi:3-oxoacyl-[acyl-carrier-protein] synthase II